MKYTPPEERFCVLCREPRAFQQMFEGEVIFTCGDSIACLGRVDARSPGIGVAELLAAFRQARKKPCTST